eukprot:TRINITY_DN22930_c0_g1_i1.p1 TRINITY_DN22930_c0_g1~~TRINITY_DN22930_c0_g1_i1.p1  ORF type:complete len:186 (+),score=-18.58 TRINITY_DN22930_c0_g1_i1:70-627(+)
MFAFCTSNFALDNYGFRGEISNNRTSFHLSFTDWFRKYVSYTYSTFQKETIGGQHHQRSLEKKLQTVSKLQLACILSYNFAFCVHVHVIQSVCKICRTCEGLFVEYIYKQKLLLIGTNTLVNLTSSNIHWKLYLLHILLFVNILLHVHNVPLVTKFTLKFVILLYLPQTLYTIKFTHSRRLFHLH